MKNERLLDALEKVDETLIAEAAPGNKPPKKNAKTKAWVKWMALAACAVAIVGVGLPLVSNHEGANTGDKTIEPEVEGNIDTTSADSVQDVAGEAGIDTSASFCMLEICVRIDEIFPDGFRGTIEVGTDLFKEGEQITVVALDNVTIVQKEGSIFDYNELEPNIKESDLAVGNSVWVGFQTYDYTEGNGMYNQIFAYHVETVEVREGIE